MSWISIKCARVELQLDVILMCGQSFRWRRIEDGLFRSVLAGRVVSLKQDDDFLYCCIHDGEASMQSTGFTEHHPDSSVSDSRNIGEKEREEMKEVLKDYFQLHISTAKLHEIWSKNDVNFKGLYKNYSGVRVLRQDPVENLFSFICSSNNNISRITNMVEQLTVQFGCKIQTLDSATYYDFPAIDSLAEEGVEDILRKLGFGYRAKYVMKSAQFIREHGGTPWLVELRKKSYEQAKQELLKLCGVGEKVADCVLLMSLDKHDAVPIDTHIAAVVRQNYIPDLPKNKTITTPVYKRIGDHLRSLWGEYAGWAQAVVFSADLPKFKIVTDSVDSKKTQLLKRKRPR